MLQILGFLCSTTWETRIAAGQAVEAIIKNVPLWKPPATAKAQGMTIYNLSFHSVMLGYSILHITCKPPEAEVIKIKESRACSRKLPVWFKIKHMN